MERFSTRELPGLNARRPDHVGVLRSSRANREGNREELLKEYRKCTDAFRASELLQPRPMLLKSLDTTKVEVSEPGSWNVKCSAG